MMSTKSLIDCHVHLAALPDGDNGCFISPKLLRSPLFRFLLWKHDLSPTHPHDLEDVIVADEKVRMLPIEQASLVVKSIHAEQHCF